MPKGSQKPSPSIFPSTTHSIIPASNTSKHSLGTHQLSRPRKQVSHLKAFTAPTLKIQTPSFILNFAKDNQLQPHPKLQQAPSASRPHVQENQVDRLKFISSLSAPLLHPQEIYSPISSPVPQQNTCGSLHSLPFSSPVDHTDLPF